MLQVSEWNRRIKLIDQLLNTDALVHDDSLKLDFLTSMFAEAMTPDVEKTVRERINLFSKK